MPVKLWRFALWRLVLGWSNNIHFSDCALLCFSSDQYLFWELYYKNVNIKKWFFNIDNQPPPLSNKWKSNLPCISKWGFDFVEKKRPHHHSEFSSTSSIIKVPPMHNVEAPPALFIQFHKKIEWTCQSSCTMVAHIHLIFKFYVLNDVDFFDFCCCWGGRYEINFWYH